MILAILLLALGDPCEPCGGRVGLPWYDYCWVDCTDTPRVVDWPVMSRDCLRGPGVSAPHGCRQRFDFDHDWDVDLADFAVLQAATK